MSLEELFKGIALGMDYSLYGLDFNPFPAAGVTGEVTSLSDAENVLRRFCADIRIEEEKQIVKTYVAVAYNAPHIEGKAAHSWIQGRWRVGKSILLIHLWHSLRTSASLKDVVSVYVPKPRYGFIRSIYHYFMLEYLGTGFFDQVADRLVTYLIERYFDEIINKDWFEIQARTREWGKDDLIKQLKNRTLRPIDIADGIKMDRFTDRARTELPALKIVSQRIIDILTDYTMETVRRERELLELENTVKSELLADHVVSLFKACVNQERAGFTGGNKLVYLLLDDVEDMVNLWGSIKARKEADTLVSFLDRMDSHLSVLGTMHPDVIMEFKESHPRLAGRSSADPLNFKFIEVEALKQPKDTFTVVTYILSTARKKEFKPPYDTYPFRDDAVQYLHDHFRGILGEMLPSFNELLNRGIEKGGVEIDKTFVETMQRRQT